MEFDDDNMVGHGKSGGRLVWGIRRIGVRTGNIVVKRMGDRSGKGEWRVGIWSGFEGEDWSGV